MSFNFEIEVCVTHWTILGAHRVDPAALFGFKPCDEDGPHEILRFVDAALAAETPDE